MLASDICFAIERARKNMGLTMRQVAEKAEVNYQSYYAWELGITIPKGADIAKISVVLPTLPTEDAMEASATHYANKRKTKEAIANQQKISAIAWYARNMGTSYGKVQAQLTDAERERIYKEYKQFRIDKGWDRPQTKRVKTETSHYTFDEKKAYSLYLNGYTDEQISKEVGVTAQSVGRWRRKKGYKKYKPRQHGDTPHPWRKPPKQPKTEQEEDAEKEDE